MYIRINYAMTKRGYVFELPARGTANKQLNTHNYTVPILYIVVIS